MLSVSLCVGSLQFHKKFYCHVALHDEEDNRDLAPGSLQSQSVYDAMDPIQVCSTDHSHLPSLVQSGGGYVAPERTTQTGGGYVVPGRVGGE